MIFIVVPAYNEEKNIGRVIRGLFERGWRDVAVVDDGSSDRTAEEAIAVGAIVLRHPVNRGQGAALQTGDEYALAKGAEAVAHFDADGQFNPDDIAPAVKAMAESGVDVVFGSRFLDKRSGVPFLKKYFILPIARWINFLFTGVLLSDAHNGFRVLSRRVLEKIKITQDGMAHNSEIVAQIKRGGWRFIERPVEVSYSEYGQGLAGGLKIIRDLFISKITR